MEQGFTESGLQIGYGFSFSVALCLQLLVLSFVLANGLPQFLQNGLLVRGRLGVATLLGLLLRQQSCFQK